MAVVVNSLCICSFLFNIFELGMVIFGLAKWIMALNDIDSALKLLVTRSFPFLFQLLPLRYILHFDLGVDLSE